MYTFIVMFFARQVVLDLDCWVRGGDKCPSDGIHPPVKELTERVNFLNQPK